LLSSPHQAFTTTRNIEDAITGPSLKPIPRDTRLFAEFFGTFQDRCVVNLRHFGFSQKVTTGAKKN
jgi:hypothetical protein